MIAVFPLAYQLDDDYPFLPQKLFDRYCNQNAIHCIDLLPAFRKYPKDDVFLLNHPDRPDIYDIWHLTEYGHEISASVISTFLRSRNLLRGRHAGESTKMFESGASAAPG